MSSIENQIEQELSNVRPSYYEKRAAQIREENNAIDEIISARKIDVKKIVKSMFTKSTREEREKHKKDLKKQQEKYSYLLVFSNSSLRNKQNKNLAELEDLKVNQARDALSTEEKIKIAKQDYDDKQKTQKELQLENEIIEIILSTKAINIIEKAKSIFIEAAKKEMKQNREYVDNLKQQNHYLLSLSVLDLRKTFNANLSKLETLRDNIAEAETLVKSYERLEEPIIFPQSHRTNFRSTDLTEKTLNNEPKNLQQVQPLQIPEQAAAYLGAGTVKVVFFKGNNHTLTTDLEKPKKPTQKRMEFQ